MSKCIVRNVLLRTFGTNCYIVENTETKECLVVDPATDRREILDKIDELGVKPVAILLTHGHFDHIIQVDLFNEAIGNVPVYGSEDEMVLFMDADKNASSMVGRAVTIEPDVLVHDGDVIELAGFKIKVLSTPGHTIGSVCYYIEDEAVLLSGDTLFSCDFGRYDLPTGNVKQLVHSICDVLFALPDDIQVYPGHSESTVMGLEKKRNSILMYKDY